MTALKTSPTGIKSEPETASQSRPGTDVLDQGAKTIRRDCSVLAGTVLLSTLPYMFRLGFYVDDWLYQLWLTQSPRRSVLALVQTLQMHDPSIRIRPVQAFYLATSFKIFGQRPTGYHLLDALILSMLPVVIYLVLRKLGVGRWFAFTIPLVFALMPHYSTARFWISAQQATLSMILAGVGIYGFLQSRREGTTLSIPWLCLGVVGLVLSFLSYEAPLGLIVGSLAFIAFQRHREARSLPTHRKWFGFALGLFVLGLVGVLKIFFQTRIHGHSTFLTRFGFLSKHMVIEGIRFNFWTYTLKLPAVLVSLYHRRAMRWSALVVAIGVGSLASAYIGTSSRWENMFSRRTSLRLIVAGLIIFVLGYVLFFPDPGVNFSSPGLQNRITITSALGTACVLVGIVSVGCSWLRSEQIRRRASAIAIGAICAAYSLIVSGLGFFWAEAKTQQSNVLEVVSRNLRAAPEHSVILLDGFCRYSGPAIVFGLGWDTTAALQLTLQDTSLRAEVVSPSLSFEETVLVVDSSGTRSYTYGPKLFVYDLRRKLLTNLPSKQAAANYIRMMNPDQNSQCPQGSMSNGAKIF